jgi:hypothetical protein
VIDAVFSIGAHYNSTKAAILHFAEFYDLPIIRGAQVPLREEQLSIHEFLEINQKYGAERMAEEVYCNRQRTSSRNGILKAEAAKRFAQVLADFGVDHFQDVDKILGLCTFEAAVKEIPGQHSGVSLRYFYMLAGNEKDLPILRQLHAVIRIGIYALCSCRGLRKPDRMIKRFIYAATGEQLADDECQRALTEACAVLAKDYPRLTPRALDNLIWEYQRIAGRG